MTTFIEQLREAAIYGPVPCPICDVAADHIEAQDRKLYELTTKNEALERQVALLREALERCAMFKLQPDTIQQIVNRVLATTDDAQSKLLQEAPFSGD